jgi:hypothetical protein
MSAGWDWPIGWPLVGRTRGRRKRSCTAWRRSDLDCPEALALADLYLPATGAKFGRESKARSHRLYVSPGAIYEAFADPISGEMLLELRGDGREGGAHLTLLPPSIADGERRAWLNCSYQAARAALLRGELKGFRIGRSWRILPESVDHGPSRTATFSPLLNSRGTSSIAAQKFCQPGIAGFFWPCGIGTTPQPRRRYPSGRSVMAPGPPTDRQPNRRASARWRRLGGVLVYGAAAPVRRVAAMFWATFMPPRGSSAPSAAIHPLAFAFGPLP